MDKTLLCQAVIVALQISDFDPERMDEELRERVRGHLSECTLCSDKYQRGIYTDLGG